MDKFDRVYKLHQLLSGRKTPVPIGDIETRLECSTPTAYRLLRVLRDYLDAPVRFDSDRRGYLYDAAAHGGTYELPGLWFNARELQALVVFDRLLESLEPGLLADHLKPLAEKVSDMDILRHGAEVEVLSPAPLRAAVAGQLAAALKQYS